MNKIEEKSLKRYASSQITSNGGGVSLFSFATASTKAAVVTAGFFNEARGVLKKNDRITGVAEADATGVALDLMVTAAPSSGDVTVSDLSA